MNDLFAQIKPLHELERDAHYWRIHATSLHAALMLGSNLDPNDNSVDWFKECNHLVANRLEREAGGLVVAKPKGPR